MKTLNLEARYAAPWFGVLVFPALVGKSEALAHCAGSVRFWFAWAIGATRARHLAAVAWRAWVKRDDVFARMWPRGAEAGD